MAEQEQPPTVVSSEPTPKVPMGTRISNKARHLVTKVTTRDGWVGDYDFGWLCMPTLPYGKAGARKLPPFYGLDDDIPLLLAMVCGFQHALAMLAGLITPPIIFSSALSLDASTSSYLISSSLIGCGILSAVQMARIPLWGRYYWGTGLLTVVGISFATLSTGFSIFNSLYADGTCPSTTSATGTVTRGPCPDAYGMLLGTSMLCSLLNMGLSFAPAKTLKRIFPPVVTGTVIVMIGASLVGESGVVNWGGGSACHERPADGIFRLCPTIFAPRAAPWGSAQYIGLGFLSFVTILLVELFGSPFLKASFVYELRMIPFDPPFFRHKIRMPQSLSVLSSAALWPVQQLKIHPPAILPMLAVYISLAMEAIGDITASAEVSRVAVEGYEFDTRIQGGVLGDGIGGLLSGLMTNPPLSIFAQNNGVIAITRCANRKAGWWCCSFLILFGILGKISGVFLSIPNPVLGGVTTFLFATVMTSGIRVLSYITWSRRNRFTLAAAMSFGVGNLLAPTWYTFLFEDVDNPSPGLRGLFDSITIVLSTPFLSAGIVSVLLNLILPDNEVVPKDQPPEPTEHDIEAHPIVHHDTESISSDEKKRKESA
ncbi:hypothetical protein FRC18_002158 [Serendipita sp. 400]|nr:hypothetical protein FRC18_002158 [Serendipita sp. 400]